MSSADSPDSPLHFYLVRFAKSGPARYISQHDVRRAWERANRRARLPLAYSRGFSPKPRLSFGPPLQTGAEGLREYMIMALQEALCAEEVRLRLSAAAIDGLPVVAVTPSRRSKARPLWADYHLHLSGPSSGFTERVAGLRGDEPVMVPRGGAGVVRDIRPGVLDIELATEDRLNARLSLDPEGMVTPRDLSAALGTEFARITRRDIELAADA